MAYGPLAALDDRPRRAMSRRLHRKPRLGWCLWRRAIRPKEHGYPNELWTTRLLARHAREKAPAVGHGCLGNLVQGTVCKILAQKS
jgi:hypothetical protein